MYNDNWLDYMCVLWDIMYLECAYTYITQRFGRLVCVWGRVMMLIDLLRCNVWYYTYTCILQRFERPICVYSQNIMSNSFLWFNVGCECILVFPKGSKDLYGCKAIILYQLLSCDVMFGSIHISVFPKGLEDLYVHKGKT
jgi:hypothetical protein